MKIYYSRRWLQINFYSHKWSENGEIKRRLLRTHLVEVGKNAYNSLKGINLELNNDFLYKSSIIIGCLHDFGKYTGYFQDYLETGKENKYKSHAFISALYASYCALKNDFPEEYVLYIYLSIKHHHGNLCNLDYDIGISDKEYMMQDNIRNDLDISKEQLKNLRKNKLYIISDMQDIFDFGVHEKINMNFIDNFLNDDLNSIFKKLITVNKNFRYGKNQNLNIDFSEFLLLYSLLIDSDKRNAASINNHERKKIPLGIVDKYKTEKLNETMAINNIRNDLYNSVKNNVKDIDLKNHFFEITSPTGTGKTLAGLYAALSIREKIYDKLNKLYRIIYTLPFTTIVDQNYDVARNILDVDHEFYNNDERYILKHHHLSVLTGRIDNKELPVDEALMLTEDWDSEIIFTTFVQLFSSLVGYKNKSLKKYFRIANSIIILDEIQAINIEKWENIRFILNFYAEKFDIYFILMSATQPELIKNSIELGGDFKKRFAALNRVKMHVDMKKSTPENIIDKYINYNSTSKLFVFNTIKTSIQAYNYLKSKDNKNFKIYYLSSNIIPLRKNEIIKKIKKEIENNNKITVVATQIFEAGIDISFDIVIRDLAPIDSLVQSSGRVNRNSSNAEGNIYVVNCAPENNGYDGYYCKLVYGKIHTDTTLKILKDKNVIEEKDYLGIINEYYHEINGDSIESSDSLKNAFKNLAFSNKGKENYPYYVSNFSIIDDLDKYVSIFVEIDNKARDIIEKYKNRDRKIYNNTEIISLRREMYNYIISARPEDIKNIVCEPLYANSKDFYIIHYNYLSNSYDCETGLKKVSNGTLMT